MRDSMTRGDKNRIPGAVASLEAVFGHPLPDAPPVVPPTEGAPLDASVAAPIGLDHPTRNGGA